MSTVPQEPPEQSAPRIIASFFVEYLPGVRNDYELLEGFAEGPLGLSLPDLQMETLIFALHCLDRAVFAQWGQEYRDVFMDYAFGTAYDAFAGVLTDELREPFLVLFERQCQARNLEYSAMKLLPGADGGLKGVLGWEYAKRICGGCGVENHLAMKAMLDGAAAILAMMQRIAPTL